MRVLTAIWLAILTGFPLLAVAANPCTPAQRAPGTPIEAPHAVFEAYVVADYDQVTVDQPAPNGYLYCALTRFAVDLDTLPEGLYTFTIFVDGREVAESSARIEKRFFTRGTWAVIVLVIGLGLLAFLRRGKEQRIMSR